MQTPKISLIICSRNRRSQLEPCLLALAQSPLPPVPLEVVLVDSHSTDATLALMHSFRQSAPFPVQVVPVGEKGLGLARNHGLAAAKGEILVFTDDDCYLAPDFLIRASTIFDHQTFRYCGGQILLFDPTDAPYGVIAASRRQLIPPQSFIRAGQFQGANLVIHREVIDKIGLFDPELGAGKKFRFEDIDFIARASRAGFTGAVIPELIVYHHHRRKPGPEIAELIQENDWARGAYYVKMALLGDRQYLRHYLTSVATPRQKLRELSGGISYLWGHLHRTPPADHPR